MVAARGTEGRRICADWGDIALSFESDYSYPAGSIP